MAHYAQVNSDGIVVQVLVMDNDMETNQGEAACIAWLQKMLTMMNGLKPVLIIR